MLMKILMIIPAYNEEKNILNTINQIKKYQKFKLDYIVINDGSRDRTEEVLEEHQIPHIRLIQNLGIGGAVQTGYKFALKYDYDIAIQFDGDGQHDVNYVKTIVDPILKEEADMVVGSRFVDQTMDNFKSSFFTSLFSSLIIFFSFSIFVPHLVQKLFPSFISFPHFLHFILSSLKLFLCISF